MDSFCPGDLGKLAVFWAAEGEKSSGSGEEGFGGDVEDGGLAVNTGGAENSDTEEVEVDIGVVCDSGFWVWRGPFQDHRSLKASFQVLTGREGEGSGGERSLNPGLF